MKRLAGLALVAALAGVALVSGPQLRARWALFWAADACLDRGAAWDRAAGACSD